MALLVRAENRLLLRVLGTSTADRAARALGDAFATLANADAGAERTAVESAVLGHRTIKRAKAPFFSVAKMVQDQEGAKIEIALLAGARKAAELIAQSLVLDGLLFVTSGDEISDLKGYKTLSAAAATRRAPGATLCLALVGADEASALARDARTLGAPGPACHARDDAFGALKGVVRTILTELSEGKRPWEVV